MLRSPNQLENPAYLAVCDSSQGSSSCGLTGYISGLYLPAWGENISCPSLENLEADASRVLFDRCGDPGSCNFYRSRIFNRRNTLRAISIKSQITFCVDNILQRTLLHSFNSSRKQLLLPLTNDIMSNKFD